MGIRWNGAALGQFQNLGQALPVFDQADRGAQSMPVLIPVGNEIMKYSLA
jgi:hypothetical protein